MSLACIILAAGQGTRMRSSLPKVLHHMAGFPLISHVVQACEFLKADHIFCVLAPDMASVKAVVEPCECVIQTTPLGTGDAVKAARDSLLDFEGDIIVLFGDTPLVTPDSLQTLRDRKTATNAAIVVSAFLPDDPLAYGRVLADDSGVVSAIVESADATPEQKQVRLCNGGLMLFDARHLWPLLDKLRNDNAKKEYYLTDCVALANAAGLKVVVETLPVDDVAGVNTRLQLAALEKVMQTRLREKHMLAGVTMLDPDSVYLCVDTQLGQDVVIGPHVVFGQGVTVADKVEIRAFSHLEKVSIDMGATIGPFARLRPGATIGAGAHIGNFVEIKNSSIAAGAKVNHLSYIGDATVGAKANIGAGTITCNYDGYSKTRTEIGAGAFIGSNTALVAPVAVGAGAIIGAGSTITQDVPPDSLAVARERQSHSEGWAKRFREIQESVRRIGRA
ncbi:MAG: bifunctional UDP-N-acetylglucosamine diphosphorylase/glucosamine-1-phosphate N-acetyltransferase GlmU [Alphaproteobacteria bacterium]|nr:bifunctional UDP-N-acetylglucosamine diphosphorylase/glucosamine-1-phosphate N-acetyltransferase GlmU [Alphaproteobacteria bacterium]